MGNKTSFENELRHFVGKKVHITFESERFDGTYNLTGMIDGVDSGRCSFSGTVSDYPDDEFKECEFASVRTSLIRSVEEVES